MKRLLAGLLGICLVTSGCAFSRMTAIDSTPTGAKLKISGEVRGQTPITTKIGCSTFGEKEIELSKDGHRTFSSELNYVWRGRNIGWSILFWPGLLIVGKCPKETYHFELDPISASLQGKSTLKIVELNSDFDIYVGDQQVLPGQRLVFSPGWQNIGAEIEGHVRPLGEVWMEENTDYVINLDVGAVNDRERP